MDIVEFLTARLQDDEDAARDATPGPWAMLEPSRGYGTSTDIVAPNYWPSDWRPQPGHPYTVAGCCENDGALENADAEHVVRWQPSRVLAEVAAKRAIVERATRRITVDLADNSMADKPAPVVVDAWHALCALAAVYADHPEFDPTWSA